MKYLIDDSEIEGYIKPKSTEEKVMITLNWIGAVILILVVVLLFTGLFHNMTQ